MTIKELAQEIDKSTYSSDPLKSTEYLLTQWVEQICKEMKIKQLLDINPTNSKNHTLFTGLIRIKDVENILIEGLTPPQEGEME